MLHTTRRAARLGRDLLIRTVTCFAISIAIGWIAVGFLHLGTAYYFGSVCGSITIGLVLASLAGWPPAYLTKYLDDSSDE